jgi:NitT/TauT family transport system ATP-binding protein
MAYIEIKDLCKNYRGPNGSPPKVVEVLSNISLQVQRGEFVTIFGPNGCGKTTLLMILSGLLEFDSGEVLIDNKPPGKARISFIFQNYADSLFPWRTNLDNIAFPLELQGIPLEERREKARDLLGRLNIGIDERSYPYQLSAGQQQLVAIARGLNYDPDVLVMDEPFGSLDFQTRLAMQQDVLNIWEKTKTTVLFVSHDVDEAVYLSDRILLLSKLPGRVLQLLNNRLPRPRSAEMVNSDEFLGLRSRALSVFWEALRE